MTGMLTKGNSLLTNIGQTMLTVYNSPLNTCYKENSANTIFLKCIILVHRYCLKKLNSLDKKERKKLLRKTTPDVLKVVL